MKRRIFYIALLVVALVGSVPVGTAAQTKPQAALLFTKVAPGNGSLELRQVFTILDSSGQPIPKDQIKPDGEGLIYGPTFDAAPAKIEAATTPIRISLIIDASGSMDEEMDNVRNAAVSFVRKVPNNAEIAVFKFSDTPELVHNFTRKDQLGLIENAILSIQNREPGTGNTCFYNAALEGIKAANSGGPNQEARPAVVIFTDGEDSGSERCGPIKEDQVVNQARQSSAITTQVHTIGLCDSPTCDNVNRGALESLSKRTFALTTSDTLERLDQLFDTILSALNSQWLVTANIKPPQGPQKATIDFNALINDIPASITLTSDFDSPTSFTAGPPKIEIARSQIDLKNNQYVVTLSVTNPDQVKEVTLKVHDEGSTIPLQAETKSTDIGPTMTMIHSFEGLKEGRKFCEDIRAIDIEDREILLDGKPLLASGCQEHTAQPTFELAGKPTFDHNSGEFMIKVTNIQSISGVTLLYEGSISQGDQPIMELGGTLPQDGVIKVSARDKLNVFDVEESKNYILKLTLIDQRTDERFTAPNETFTVPGRPRMGLMSRIVTALTTPLVLGSSLVIVVVVAGVVVAATLLTENRRRHFAQPKDIHGPLTELGHKPAARGVPVAAAASGGATEIEDGALELQVRFVETPDAAHNQDRVIKQFPCVIGRENSAFLIQGDGKISRQHAQISLEGNKIVVEDLGSSNGTAFVVRDSSGAYTVTKLIPKQGSAVWDNRSLIRIGTKTVIELIPQGSLQGGAPRTHISGFDNRTEIVG
ncbi:MAG TPA: VWA domain-containing protein [Herpetosiphonaceae bacterium]